MAEFKCRTYDISSAFGKLLHQLEKPTVTVPATAIVSKNDKMAPNKRLRSHICSLKVSAFARHTILYT